MKLLSAALLGADEADVLAALKHNIKYLRGEVARRVKLKLPPDESFDEATRVDSLLRTPKVSQDLGEDDGE